MSELAAPPAVRPFLRVQTGSQPPVEVELVKVRTTLGRSPRADIPLDDPFTSRLHAELRVAGRACFLRDLGSSNGTFVNGELLQGEVEIVTGDRVRIGETELQLLSSASSPSSAEAWRSDSSTSVIDLSRRESSGTHPRLAAVFSSMKRATGASPDLEDARQRRDLFAMLTKVGIALLSTSSLEEVLEEILALVFDGIPAERAFLILQGEQGPEIRAASFRRTGERTDLDTVGVSSSVQREVLEEGRSVLTTDAQVDERFRDQQSVVLSGVRSIMAVPLSTGEATLGLLYVDSPLEVRLFSHQDLQLLTAISSVAAVKVENALLLEQRIENERLKEQLRKARDIQLRLGPSEPPAVPGYELNGISFPCFEVGGDYFDFFPMDDGRVALALGDVAGKGLDAALLMSSLHACLRSQALAGLGVGEVVARVNGYLCATSPGNKFATLFCAYLDPQSHRLIYANAGHNPPLLVRTDDTVELLAATGMPTGLMANARYQTAEAEVRPGDLLLVYSDGISEAAGSDGEELGTERLAAVLRRHRQLSTAALRDRIDEAIVDFLGDGSPQDDMTLVLLKRLPG